MEQIGRLAMRVEGNFWVAYYAMPDTMEGAIELGRIAMAAVGPENLERKQMYMGMMRDFVSDMLNDRIGHRPEWPEPEGRPAPQHERSGKA
jgi:hypothetical protein